MFYCQTQVNSRRTIATVVTRHPSIMSNKQKRKRTDTFWANMPEDNAQYFADIVDDRNPIYRVNPIADVNLDYNSRRRSCWRVLSKATNQPVDGLRSTATYRLSLLWSIHSVDFWSSMEKKQKVQAMLPTIVTKRGNHSRHRCPNSWCCNPSHIQIGTRVHNEVDKHFHYFLSKDEIGVEFMDTFRSLCKKQKVWGKYPPTE